MVDGIHIHTWNRSMKPLAIALKLVLFAAVWGGGEWWYNQCTIKGYWELTQLFPLYNEYMVIKMKK
jgi:hypothetical protein